VFISLVDLDTWVYLETREISERHRHALEARRAQKVRRHNVAVVTNTTHPDANVPNRAARRANQRLTNRLMKKLTRGKR